MKECSCCHLDRSSENFYTTNPWTCIDCVKARAASRYRAKKEECMAYAKEWAAAHPERTKEIKKGWRDRNNASVVQYARYRRELFPAAIKEAQDKYKAENPEIYSAAAAKRRAAVLNALPVWADLKVVDLFYEFAKLLSEATEEIYEVDHIVPLQGELVSGLHVENNLRVVPRTVNRKKSNKYEGELA